MLLVSPCVYCLHRAWCQNMDATSGHRITLHTSGILHLILSLIVGASVSMAASAGRVLWYFSFCVPFWCVCTSSISLCTPILLQPLQALTAHVCESILPYSRPQAVLGALFLILLLCSASLCLQCFACCTIALLGIYCCTDPPLLIAT